MADVEASTQERPSRSTRVNNPYNEHDPSVLPTWHPINVLHRVLYMGCSLYGLHYFQAYQKLMQDPNISHEWFKVGLAATVAIIFIKAYVEMYSGKLKNQAINYKNFRATTHTVMTLLVLSSIAFHVSLWPVYGAKSVVVMTLVGMFILNFCFLMPTYVQNLAAFALLTFFIQEYS